MTTDNNHVLPTPTTGTESHASFEFRRSEDRGHANFGWLEAKHSFSFGSYYDPQHLGFSDLLVINDDRIQPNRGFDTHGHENMEIFTYILSGALEHKDSMGNGSVIYPGDVQMMSAGTGVKHSEFNATTDQVTHLLQIWIVPNRKDVQPRYQQIHLEPHDLKNKLRLIISPTGESGSLSVYQDTYVYAGVLDGENGFTYQPNSNRYTYLHVARGSLSVNGIDLKAGDALKVRQNTSLNLSNGQSAEVLIFDLRPVELPQAV